MSVAHLLSDGALASSSAARARYRSARGDLPAAWGTASDSSRHRSSLLASGSVVGGAGAHAASTSSSEILLSPWGVHALAGLKPLSYTCSQHVCSRLAFGVRAYASLWASEAHLPLQQGTAQARHWAELRVLAITRPVATCRRVGRGERELLSSLLRARLGLGGGRCRRSRRLHLSGEPKRAATPPLP